MFEELKELICEYVDVNPSDIKEESRFIEGAMNPRIIRGTRKNIIGSSRTLGLTPMTS